VTKLVRDYLMDFRQALERDHAQRWKTGRLDADAESEAKGRVNQLEDLGDNMHMVFDAMLNFYEEPVSEEASEHESDTEPQI
jgi:hypothetical protein